MSNLTRENFLKNYENYRSDNSLDYSDPDYCLECKNEYNQESDSDRYSFDYVGVCAYCAVENGLATDMCSQCRKDVSFCLESETVCDRCELKVHKEHKYKQAEEKIKAVVSFLETKNYDYEIDYSNQSISTYIKKIVHSENECTCEDSDNSNCQVTIIRLSNHVNKHADLENTLDYHLFDSLKKMTYYIDEVEYFDFNLNNIEVYDLIEEIKSIFNGAE